MNQNYSHERPIAYFCAEYGLDAHLPLYAGGLGVLAGDTLKQAADDHLPMVGIGMLYRGKKAIQKISIDGRQSEEDMPVDPVDLGFHHVYVPKEDQPLFVRIHLTTQDVWARVWKTSIGSVALYLLDTDTDQNRPEDRRIGQALYHGTDEDVVRQQMILGIGGIKLLDALEIHPQLYHVNEGRPAFLFWQLIRQHMERSGLTYREAFEVSKKSIVYTNHTLVKEGNKSYDTTILAKYAGYYAEKMKVSIDELLKPGIDPETNRFSLSQFAINTSRKASAVSQIHFELSQKQWPQTSWEGITNGVHLPTWQDPDISKGSLEGDRLWHLHQHNKNRLAEYVQTKTGFSYDPKRLVIGWARRFANYKRADALFHDINRLKSIVSKEGREVQILLSGRAHTDDEQAKNTLHRIITHMQNELAGYALFIPNYDMEVASYMVRGVDVWLNTPIKGQEASGTSGMKATANGVLQCTVEDGWAAEVDWYGVGWTLDSENLNETLYFRLEKDIIPTFYDRNEHDIPTVWLERMKKTLLLTPRFSTKRMLDEYRLKLYT